MWILVSTRIRNVKIIRSNIWNIKVWNRNRNDYFANSVASDEESDDDNDKKKEDDDEEEVRMCQCNIIKIRECHLNLPIILKIFVFL